MTFCWYSALVRCCYRDVECGSASIPRWDASRIALKARSRARGSAAQRPDAIRPSRERSGESAVVLKSHQQRWEVDCVLPNEASLLRLRRLSDALQEYLAKRGALSEVRDGVGEGAESAVSAAKISTL